MVEFVNPLEQGEAKFSRPFVSRYERIRAGYGAHEMTREWHPCNANKQ